MKLNVKLNKEQLKAIHEVISVKFACSSEKLTIETLAQMLLEDVAMAVTRPGSWEGANMIAVLSSHGWGGEE